MMVCMNEEFFKIVIMWLKYVKILYSVVTGGNQTLGSLYIVLNLGDFPVELVIEAKISFKYCLKISRNRSLISFSWCR